jgi:hypothetical protein
VGLLHPAGGRGGLAGRLGRQLLPRRLAAGRLPRRLLGAGHWGMGSGDSLDDGAGWIGRLDEMVSERWGD